MKIKLLLIAGLISFICQGQTYRFEQKEVRTADSWRIDEIRGVITITSSEIMIEENGKFIYFEIRNVRRLIKQDFFIYGCADQKGETYQIVLTNWDESGKYIELLLSKQSVYYKYCLEKI